MNIQPKKRNTQQGYILVVALIAMLFLGAIFIASTNRSGTEERVAISQLHAASLESALYAGLYRVKKASEEAHKEENKTKPKMLCLDVETEINALPKKQKFQAATDQEAGIFWEVTSVEAKCGLEKPEVYFGLVAWQGNEGKPISRLAGKGKILIIKDTGNSGSGSGSGSGVFGGLFAALGNNAATSSGETSITGGAKIYGNTTGNSIKVSGGGEVIAGNLAYQDLDVPDWYQWKDEDDFWYNSAEKNPLAEAVKVDPLGLKKGVEEAFFTDENGKEIPLIELTKTRVKDEFNRQPGGKKVEIGQWPFQRATLKPTQLEVYNDRAKTNQTINLPFYQPVSFLDENIALMALDEFKIKSGGKDPSLTVSGGRVIVFVDGDVEMDGGASMQIANDSSLTLIVTGKFKLTGGFKFLDEKGKEKGINDSAVNSKGEPLFTLLSANTKDAKAVEMTGGTMFFGVVYALSDLNLGGSGTIVGQAFGANINANGGTAVNYQPAFGGGGASGGSGGGSGGSEFTPKLDSDFEINY